MHYVVVKDHTVREFGISLQAGETVDDGALEPDVIAALTGRGIIADADAPEFEVEFTDIRTAEYNGMSKAELVREAERRQIDVSALKTKPELVDALLASDGVTEDEQAALDQSDEAKG